MKSIRRGNAFWIKWQISRNGEPVESLGEHDLELIVSSPRSKQIKTKQEFEVHSSEIRYYFDESGIQDLGVYSLTLVDKTAHVTIDLCDAFELVACTCQTGGEDDFGFLELDGYSTDFFASGVGILTPSIGENGNWWIDGKDTGVRGDIAAAERAIEALQHDSVFGRGTSKNSAVLKGEYEGYSNQAISQTSVAVGAGTVAGLKGWYYSKIDFFNKTITLSDAPTYILAGSTLLNGGWSSGTPNINVGDIISLVNDSKYDLCSTVTAVNGNVITVDTLPFFALVKDNGAMAAVPLGQFSDGYSVYIPDRPDAGIIDFGGGAFAEGGLGSMATNVCAHAEGLGTHAYGQFSHAEGRETKAGHAAHAEGKDTTASGEQSHSEGNGTTARGICAHSEGKSTIGGGYNSHVEGQNSMTAEADPNDQTISITERPANSGNADRIGQNAHAEGRATYAEGNSSHSEGGYTYAKGQNAHAEGLGCEAIGQNAHAEGKYTKAIGNNSHAGGNYTKANGAASHAEGNHSCAQGVAAHAEGFYTEANGLNSHAEGNYSCAQGGAAHAEGFYTEAYGNYSHAEGARTITNNEAEHASGICNSSTSSADNAFATLFSIGIGTSVSNRKNAVEVKKNGDIYIVGIDAALQDYIANLEARISELEAKLS